MESVQLEKYPGCKDRLALKQNIEMTLIVCAGVRHQRQRLDRNGKAPVRGAATRRESSLEASIATLISAYA